MDVTKKDLIVIAAHCPTESKEKKLLSLLDSLLKLKDKFDILITGHTLIDKKILEKVEHFYYDSNNDISSDFDLSYLAWFENEDFFIESSLVYNTTTAIAIGRTNRYVINFANFWGYKKIHYMEYDFLYPGDDFILENNKYLDEYDTIMLEHPLNTGLFASSVYYAFNTNGLEEESKNFDRENFIQNIRNSHNLALNVGWKKMITNHGRMTENMNVIMFSKNNRKNLYLPPLKIDQTEDSHNNTEMKWVIPIYDKNQNCILLFIYNIFAVHLKIQVKINNDIPVIFECPPNSWTLNYLTDFENDKNIEIYVDGKLQKNIDINNLNKEKFVQNSYIIYKD